MSENISPQKVKILVLGCGIIGLSTSVALQNLFSEKRNRDDGNPSRKGQFNIGNYLRECLKSELDIEKFSKKQVEVTIPAENLPPHTTGDVAAGLWSPVSLPDDNPEVAKYDIIFI